MKITQVCYPGLGGHSSVVFSLIAADQNLEHKWNIGFIGNEELTAQNLSQCNKWNVHNHFFSFERGRRITAWLDLFKWLRASKPDAVLCHSPAMVLPCFFYSYLYSARLAVVEHTSNSAKTKAEWFCSISSLILCRNIIVLTDSYLDELRLKYKSLYFFLQNRFTVIPNGVDTNFFSKKLSAKKKLKKSILTIGMAARFTPGKRQDLLIEALSCIVKSLPELSITLSFAGDGETLQACKKLAYNENLNSVLSFEGMLGESELSDWFNELDMYVLATESENLNTSLLQAMSFGLPIIASDVPGVSNLLSQEKEYGLLCANSHLEFSEKIIKLAECPNDQQLFGQNARYKVVEKYSNLKMFQSYVELLS